MASFRVLSSLITFTGSPQQVSSRGAIRELHIQADPANLNPFYVGGPDVSSTNGIIIPTPVAGLSAAPYIIDGFDDGRLEAVDVWVVGTAAEKARLMLLLHG
jgi:hypothetical protein